MNIQTTNTVASVSKDREAEQRIILFTMRVLETRLIQLESCDWIVFSQQPKSTMTSIAARQ